MDISRPSLQNLPRLMNMSGELMMDMGDKMEKEISPLMATALKSAAELVHPISNLIIIWNC